MSSSARISSGSARFVTNGIGQDVGEIAARLDLAHHVVHEDLLLAGAEEALQKVVGVGHSRQYTDMEPKPEVTRFAERTVRGRDDHGDDEVVTIWIDRLPGRGLERRPGDQPRAS